MRLKRKAKKALGYLLSQEYPVGLTYVQSETLYVVYGSQVGNGDWYKTYRTVESLQQDNAGEKKKKNTKLPRA